MPAFIQWDSTSRWVVCDDSTTKNLAARVKNTPITSEIQIQLIRSGKFWKGGYLNRRTVPRADEVGGELPLSQDTGRVRFRGMQESSR